MALNSVRDFFGNLERDVERGIQTLRNNIRFSTGNEDDEEHAKSYSKQSSAPRNNVNRRLSVAAESFDPAKESDDDTEEKRCIIPKTDSQRARLLQAVNGILLFKCLDENQIAKIIDAMMELKVSTGDHVIKQGEDGDNFYVIEKGNFDIYVKSSSSKSDDEELGKKLGSYADSGSFGELALMYNTPRAATIVATTPGILWVMDRVTFRRIVLKAAFQKRQYYENLLESVPMLSELSPYERTNVADALIRKTFNDGDRLISQNDPGNELYFVEDGTVKITIKKDNKEVEISRLQKGEYFGELALITKSPRAASAYAIGSTKVAVLDVASFERLLGPCVDVMQRNIETYNKQLEELMGSDNKGNSSNQ